MRWIRVTIGLVVLSLATGCSSSEPQPAEPVSKAASPMARQKTDAKIAYTHDLSIGLPPEKLVAHFKAARDRCLDDAALRCTIVQSSIGEVPGPSGRPRAQLRVRLPHESVPAYIAFVTMPLADEKAEDVVLREQATQAEDLTRVLEDGSRRLAQLKDYRDRLTVLAAKAETKVEDLIKIAEQLSQVQGQIEEGEANQRGLDQRVDTELVTLNMRSDQARAGAFAPVKDAWEQSSRILGDSAGSALRFAVSALPWLPIAVIVLLLLRVVWRMRRKRRPGPMSSGGNARS